MTEIQRKIAEKLEELKCSDIRIYDVRDKTPLNEYMIVATARSSGNMTGPLNAVEKIIQEEQLKLHHIEYKAKNLWCLIDVTDFLVHIFAPGERERIRFDELYSKCPCEIVSEKVDDYKEENDVSLTEISYWDE